MGVILVLTNQSCPLKHRLICWQAEVFLLHFNSGGYHFGNLYVFLYVLRLYADSVDTLTIAYIALQNVKFIVLTFVNRNLNLSHTCRIFKHLC